MSIPKEPRQLMINVMYLVLTAMLALNVSAEIFNAFDMVNGGLETANASLDASNKKLPQLIKDGAKKKASLQVYADRIPGVQATSTEATGYIDNIVNQLIDASGNNNGSVDDGDYVMVGEKRELVGKKDYSGTTRLMVDEGKGGELRAKIEELKGKYLSFVDEKDRAEFAKDLPLNIDDESWKKAANKKASWEDYTFGHMPLGATMPLFTKFKNDIKSSESKVLNYLASKVGTTTDVVLDKFTVVSAPKKSYIIKGEKFETDVFLSASAGSDSNTGISLTVNGKRVPTNKDGVAKYTETASSVGIKKYSAAATVTNPTTGERKTYKSNFEYEVGERSVAISASKMNVFYIGVDNPVEISAAGVPSNQIKVSMNGGGGTIKRNPDGTYNVRVSTPTKDAKVNVSAPGMNVSKTYRVKKIPSPVPMLSKKKGGVMSSGEFKNQPGVFPVLENFDFEARCKVKGYRVVRVAPRQEAQIAPNVGGKFTGKAANLMKLAKPGDRYFFEGIKATCPGDKAARDIGGMTFTIR